MAQWNNGSGQQGVDQAPVHSRYVPGSESAYLKAKVNGQEVYVVLDTGSQLNLCSEKYVRPQDIRPTKQRLYAANNTKIAVKGQAFVKLNNMNFRVPVLVTPQLDDLLLGLGWMSAQGTILDLCRGWLRMWGKRIDLHYRPGTGRCYRSTLQSSARDTVHRRLEDGGTSTTLITESKRERFSAGDRKGTPSNTTCNRRVGPVLYQIRKTQRSKAQLVYVDKLKAYSGPIPLAWGGSNFGEEEVPDLEEVEVPVSHLDLGRPKRKIQGPVRYGFEN